MNHLFTILYFLSLVALFLFSNYFLDNASPYSPKLGILFLIIVSLLTLCYLYFLNNPPKRVLLYIILSLIIMFPSYPATLSNDVYNYAMDAKILVVYHQNPWIVPPKFFPQDPLFSLVHWKDDPSRYGPIWIVPTAFLYWLWPSIFSFKLFTAANYLLSLWLINKLRGNITFIFFNPLIILEYLLGTHTDIVMTTFVLFALYHRSLIAMLAAVLVKITALPLLLGLFFKNKYFWVWLAYLGSFLIIVKWSINPWYFTLPIFLTALITHNKFYKYLAINLSIAAIVRYFPLLYLGWFDPNNKIRAALFIIFMLPFGFWVLKSYFLKTV